MSEKKTMSNTIQNTVKRVPIKYWHLSIDTNVNFNNKGRILTVTPSYPRFLDECYIAVTVDYRFIGFYNHLLDAQQILLSSLSV